MSACVRVSLLLFSPIHQRTEKTGIKRMWWKEIQDLASHSFVGCHVYAQKGAQRPTIKNKFSRRFIIKIKYKIYLWLLRSRRNTQYTFTRNSWLSVSCILLQHFSIFPFSSFPSLSSSFPPFFYILQYTDNTNYIDLTDFI